MVMGWPFHVTAGKPIAAAQTEIGTRVSFLYHERQQKTCPANHAELTGLGRRGYLKGARIEKAFWD
jgi:hypothetical protein